MIIDLFSQNKVPGNMKSSPEATALKVFVVVLFSLCFAIVLLAHILYNQHIGEVDMPRPQLETNIVLCNYYLRLGFSRQSG